MLHVQTWCTREASYRDSRGYLESVRPVGDRLPGTTHEPRSTRRAKKSSVAKECQRSDDQIAQIENSWASWYFMNHHDTSWLSGFSWNSMYRDPSSWRSNHTLAALAGIFNLSQCVWFEVCPVFCNYTDRIRTIRFLYQVKLHDRLKDACSMVRHALAGHYKSAGPRWRLPRQIQALGCIQKHQFDSHRIPEVTL